MAIRRYRYKSDEFLDKMFAEITAELLEKARQVKELGELYDKQTAEHEKRTAEHEKKTAEHEKRTAEHEAKAAEHEARAAKNEIIAAQHAERAAEYKAMSLRHAEKTAENEEKIARLEEVLTTAQKLGDLLDTGTGLLKTLTPLQIEFNKQVNQRAELTNEIAAKIKISNTLLDEGRYDELEEKITVLDVDFQKLARHVETENKAQDEVIEVLDQYEAIVNQIKSTLETIKHQQDYYSTLKKKSYDVELDYLEKATLALEENRPAKVGSDELGQQCEQAFSLIKRRLQQRKEAESLPSSRASTPPSEVKDSPLSRSSDSEASDIAIGRSSPSRSDLSDFDDEKKGMEIEHRFSLYAPAILISPSTTSQISLLLQSAERSPFPQPQKQQPPPQLSHPAGLEPEIPEASVSVVSLSMYKPKPFQAPEVEAREPGIKSGIT